MMKATSLEQKLSQAWKRAIIERKIVNEFEARDDDPQGRWNQKDKVTFGLRLAGKQIEYFAENTTQQMPIEAEIREEPIEGTSFCIQFNGYRALRPGGSPAQIGRQADISPDAIDCRFYCQYPTQSLSLLRREPLNQLILKNFCWNAYYNAAPFEKSGHILWIPVSVHEPITSVPHIPQRLSLLLLDDLLSLSRKFTSTIIFFNSLHAGASVNHFHAQAVVKKGQYAIEQAATSGYGGYEILEGYPANGLVFEKGIDTLRLFVGVDQLQQEKTPFNLI